MQLKKEIQRVQKETEEIEMRSMGIEEVTNDVITKKGVLNRELRPISYRF